MRVTPDQCPNRTCPKGTGPLRPLGATPNHHPSSTISVNVCAVSDRV